MKRAEVSYFRTKPEPPLPDGCDMHSFKREVWYSNIGFTEHVNIVVLGFFAIVTTAVLVVIHLF